MLPPENKKEQKFDEYRDKLQKEVNKERKKKGKPPKVLKKPGDKMDEKSGDDEEKKINKLSIEIQLDREMEDAYIRE